MSGKNAKTTKNRKILSNIDLPSLLIKIGLVLIILSAAVFVAVFYPLIISELKYVLFRPNKDVNIVVNEDKIPQEKVSKSDYLKPADPSFSIIIPKIGANSAVVANVDPHDSREYQRALTKGVAHAKGSVFPGQIGNTFLFSHSSVNVYDANRYNSVFYLLRKLNEDDVFYLIYQGEIYQYRVSETKIVEADDVKYLDANTQKNQATLMTCWPPGTTLQRLLVIGDLVSIQK